MSLSDVTAAAYADRGTAHLNAQEHEQAIALHAHRLTLRHPIRYDEVVLTAPLPPTWRELGFGEIDTNPTRQ